MTVTAQGPQVAFFSNRTRRLGYVYPEGRVAQIRRLANTYEHTITLENFHEHAPALAHVEYIFSTWGMPELTARQIAELPDLKAVFYAAGTVKYFAGPFLECGVRVVSAWAANAVPVGEYTAAQIILAGKGYFAANRRMHRRESLRDLAITGNYGSRVALLGAGMVGREVIRRLHGYDIELLVFDPFLADADAHSLGVTKVTLEEAFDAAIVSNHLANVPETVGMITGKLLRRMPEGGTFINTGRGATVREDEMLDVLQERADLTALLDVTDPEPPVDDSPLYRLANVWLTPHIAGSLGNEVVRMADLMIEEFERELTGQPLRYEVKREHLATMA
ncbi:MAG: hydroxyacid dehydrogenase [Pseudomonadales bacterium]|nr:hydroxyacid dehydrogenase [Pseudomonadales bacterium]